MEDLCWVFSPLYTNIFSFQLIDSLPLLFVTVLQSNLTREIKASIQERTAPQRPPFSVFRSSPASSRSSLSFFVVRIFFLILTFPPLSSSPSNTDGSRLIKNKHVFKKVITYYDHNETENSRNTAAGWMVARCGGQSGSYCGGSHFQYSFFFLKNIKKSLILLGRIVGRVSGENPFFLRKSKDNLHASL